MAGAEKELAAVGGACEKLAEAETQAADSYGEAAKAIQSARHSADAREKVPGLPAGEAAALTAGGYVDAVSLQLRDRIDLVAEQVAKVWADMKRQPPGGLGKMQTYVSKPEEVRQRALKKYQAARKLYKDAERKANRKNQWIYQAHVANTCYWMYVLTRDKEQLDLALRHITAAVKGRDKSPYVRSAVALRDVITRADAAAGADARPKVKGPAPGKGKAAPGPKAAPAAPSKSGKPGTIGGLLRKVLGKGKKK